MFLPPFPLFFPVSPHTPLPSTLYQQRRPRKSPLRLIMCWSFVPINPSSPTPHLLLRIPGSACCCLSPNLVHSLFQPYLSPFPSLFPTLTQSLLPYPWAFLHYPISSFSLPLCLPYLTLPLPISSPPPSPLPLARCLEKVREFASRGSHLAGSFWDIRQVDTSMSTRCGHITSEATTPAEPRMEGRRVCVDPWAMFLFISLFARFILDFLKDWFCFFFRWRCSDGFGMIQCLVVLYGLLIKDMLV